MHREWGIPIVGRIAHLSRFDELVGSCVYGWWFVANDRDDFNAPPFFLVASSPLRIRHVHQRRDVRSLGSDYYQFRFEMGYIKVWRTEDTSKSFAFFLGPYSGRLHNGQFMEHSQHRVGYDDLSFYP